MLGAVKTNSPRFRRGKAKPPFLVTSTIPALSMEDVNFPDEENRRIIQHSLKEGRLKHPRVCSESKSPGTFAVVVYAALVFVSLFACSGGPSGVGSTQSLAPVSDAEAEAWAGRTLAGLTLEEKVGQLVCPDITAGYLPDGDPRLARWEALAAEQGVGMFVLYGGTPRDVAHLLNRLQGKARLPLLIAADFEGGPGQQVVGASEFPANMAFAAAGSEDLMLRAARLGAVEGRAMGIHLTYTPVVDLAWRPENPAESVRSFGGDIDLLGKMVRAYVRGYHENGMLTSAKHFPGRGDVERMPGNPQWSWIDKPAQRVEAEEFAAFKMAVEAGVDYIMSEHIAVPSVAGGSELPASVEKKLATDWIREKLGFKGILTTDDLWYDHVVARFGAEEVALKAFEAGHDIILKPKDPGATIAALAAAVRSGRIEESRIGASARKLLTLKAKLGLHRNRFVDEARVGEFVGTPDHAALVQEIADRSLTLIKNDGALPLDEGRLSGSRTVHVSVLKTGGETGPPILAAKLAAALPGIRSFALRPDLGEAYYNRAWEAARQADLVIFSFFIQRDRMGEAAPLRPKDVAFVEKIAAAKPKAVVAMSYGNPHLVRGVPALGTFIVGYGEGGWFGNQTVYFDSFLKLLRGEIKPGGKLPVEISEEFGIGWGLGY